MTEELLEEDPQDDERDLNVMEAAWVRLTEIIHEDGTPELVLSHSEMLTPWAIEGMLSAGYRFASTVTTNIFYGQTYEEMIAPIEDDEDDDGLFA